MMARIFEHPKITKWEKLRIRGWSTSNAIVFG
jgi:hypothetical protein